MSATSIDVARLAGVSQSAVSRTFTPGASVSAATRAKVLEAAAKLGYRPNAHARSLITGRSRIVGLVVSHLDNLLYPVMLEKLALALQQDGLHVMLFINEDDEADLLIEQILQYHVDAIVLAASTLSSSLARRCAGMNVPVLLFNRIAGAVSRAPVSAVRSDNQAGGRLVAEHLIAQGCRRLAYIAGNEQSSTNVEREQGFREALAEAGLRVVGRAVGNYSSEHARLAARELFRAKDERPDGVFVASDHMAFAVMDVLREELGLRIPHDVAVAGFDDVPQAAWGAYQLTTVAPDMDRMIHTTAELLREQMAARDGAGLAPAEITLPVHLVVRRSTQRFA